MSESGVMVKKGKVYLVGAGPGDVGLLTVRGLELVRQADVIVYDYLCNPLLLRYAREDAELIFAGKQARKHLMLQSEINGLLVEKGKKGLFVVRLKGGDPFIFGRGGEEVLALHGAGVDFEVVSGVSSVSAVPAYAGVPVTHRDCASSFMVATGHVDPAKGVDPMDYSALADFKGTRVLLMGVGRLEEMVRELLARGVDENLPAAAVMWGTVGRQKKVVSTLKKLAVDAAAAGICTPAIVVFGKVVGLHGDMDWFCLRPLLGARIAVTRMGGEGNGLTDRLLCLGADVLEIPLIRIVSSESGGLECAVKRASEWDWVVLTSASGAKYFFEAIMRVHGDLRALGKARFAAVGAQTRRAIETRGVRVDITATEQNAGGLAERFGKEDLKGKKVLLPLGGLAPDDLREALVSLGADAVRAEAYRTVADTRDRMGFRARLAEEGADWVVFSSASAVVQWVEQGVVCGGGKETRFASIGPRTSEAMRREGMAVGLQSVEPSFESLAESLVGCWKG